MFKKILFIASVILLTVASSQVVQAVILELTLNVNEQNDLGENITILGNLTLDGSPVTDGLVTIQIDDPQDDLFILRTLPTGENPIGPWTIQILELTPCDKSGNPQSSFTAGGNMGMKLTVKNNGLSWEHVIITLNLYYSNGVPFKAFVFHETDMEPEGVESLTTWPIPIPVDATLGTAFAYANALDGWPKNNELAYCPEKSATFNIVSGGPGGTYTSSESQGTSTPGKFTLTFRTKPKGGITGNYTVSAVSQYQMWFAPPIHTTFEVILIGDVNGDGKVRVDDVLAVALAFGSNKGDPDWDPRYDLNNDDKVRVDDVLIVAQAFGKESG